MMKYARGKIRYEDKIRKLRNNNPTRRMVKISRQEELRK